ncbi:poly ADP-ribose polymerase 14-like [Arapaima gigas]
MGDYAYPVVILGNWTPNAAKLKNKLQIYFQSPKKSGGGDCKVEYDEDSNSATVWFKSGDARENVLQRKDHVIVIDSKLVNLNVSSKTQTKSGTSGQEVTPQAAAIPENKNRLVTDRIVLENVTENVQKDILGLMVEKISNVSEDDFSVEWIYCINKAVISFTNINDASEFLANCSKDRRFQQYNLSARPLEQPTSVMVENLPSDTTEELLELSFEREKNGGGPIKAIKMMPEEQAAIITFIAPKAVETVQNKKQYISKVPVRVYPYYESLETALYGKDRSLWNLPKPFTQSISHTLWIFLNKKNHTGMIKEHMKNYFCEADIDTSTVKLSPLPDLLKRRDLTVKHIDDWQNNTRYMLHEVLSKYKTFEYHVCASVWSKTEKYIENAVQGDVTLEFDSAKGTLTIAGLAEGVDSLKSVLEETLQKVTSQIEREKNTVSEMMELESHVFYVLQKDGIQQRARDKFPELKIDYKPQDKKLVFVGLSNEVLVTRNEILEKMLQIKQKRVQVEPSLLSFLVKVDNMEMSSEIFSPYNINAQYQIHQGVVQITSISEQALFEAETQLKNVFMSQTIDMEDKELLRKPEWLNLEADLRKIYNSPKITIEIKHAGNGKMTISGISHNVKMAYEDVSGFVNKNTHIEECVPVQSVVLLKFIQEVKPESWKTSKNVAVDFEIGGTQIKLSGGRFYVQEMKTSLLQLTSSLHIDSLRISKPGARKFYLEKEKMITGILMKDYNCMVMLQEESITAQETEEDHMVWATSTMNSSKKQDGEPSQNINKYQAGKQKTREGAEIQTKEGLSIILRKGNIQDATSTVIVNSISEDLDLSKRGVSLAILQTAGSQLQDAVREEIGKASADIGDVIVTEGYRLQCLTVFHTVCPQWDNGAGQSEKDLREIVQNCLKLAEKAEARSISFPAIGAGKLGFPTDLVPKLMLEEIFIFSKLCPFYLKEVFFIVSPSDTETVESFSRAFKSQGLNEEPEAEQLAHDVGLFGQISSPTKGTYRMQIRHLFLEVLSGDITKQTTDVIVNSSSPDFTLKTGVSKAILEGAGQAVESECVELGSQPNCGIIMTAPGNLPCRNIIHVYVKNDPMDIKEKILSVLLMCEENEFNSVSFPALGTGRGGIPASSVADVLMEALVEFATRGKVQHLQTVKVLVFQTEMVAEFHKSMQARESTALPKQKSWFSKLTDFFHGEKTSSESKPKPKKSNTHISRPMQRNTIPASFLFCAESLQDVTKAKEYLEDLILKEQMEKTIKDRCIALLTTENIKQIQELQKQHRVRITLDDTNSHPCIQLEGLTRDVMTVDSEIRDMIKEIERAESLLREAKIQSYLVQWQFVSQDDKPEPFDALTNLSLEKAFQSKESQVELKIENKDFRVNFQTLKAETWGVTFDVKRIDLIGASIPNYWDPMNHSEIKLIELKTDSKEFQEVNDMFVATCSNFTVKKIERIQNTSLWKSYQIKKRQIDEKNNHSNNEKQLFHGTSVDSIQKINAHGFNRSFCGKNAVVYGNGTYFAVEAKYSAHSTYSTVDNLGQKYMYLARVVVGNYTRGGKGLREPPPKDPSNPTDLYDSVVDKMDNPEMFVVFHDVQAYPEYLITFS